MPFYNALHHDRTTWYCLPILDIVLVRLSISICCKDSASIAETKIKQYLFDFQGGKSRAISAGFVRDLRRICSGIAPSLRAIPVEITRESGKDCA